MSSLAPIGTPDAIIRKVNADLKSAVEDKDVAAKFAANGAYERYMTPDDTVAFAQGPAKDLAADPGESRARKRVRRPHRVVAETMRTA